MRLKKNDMVEVIKGRDRGKRGKILILFPAENVAIVEGINMIQKHQRPSRANPKGGLVEREGRIRVSNLMLVDPKSGKRTKVGYSFLADGSKVRMSKISQELLA
jgi:large subunit ribosomal protein L24